MEDKNDLEKLLVSYLLGELNAEDAAYVSNVIHADPAIKKDIEDLQNLLRLVSIKQNIDGIDLLQERRRLEELWKTRKRTPAISGENQPNTGEQDERKQPAVTRWLLRAAAAACVLFVIGLGWRMSHREAGKVPVVVINNKPVPDTQKNFTRFETNVSGQIRRFLLQDGTEVLLWDQSMISFTEPFAINKRDVFLKGKASFKVAKDKTKPFTVYSDAISTTALGTEFSVTSFAKESFITIRLQEGKVVVRSPVSSNGNVADPFYLLPGQELVYNKQTAMAAVRKFTMNAAKDNSIARQSLIEDDPSVPKNNGGTWFMFNNQSLPQVFDQLKLIYSADIEYTRKEVEKLYFIGKFDKKDSLGYVLKSIVTLNNLTLTKEKNKYIIHR